MVRTTRYVNEGGLMQKFDEIDCGGQPMLTVIWDEYVENCNIIPKEQGKAFFRDWSGRVDPKLVRQCMYAGMAYALQHPEVKLIQK